jgi:hypothetical protein
MTKPAPPHWLLSLRRRQWEGALSNRFEARTKCHSRNLFRAASIAARTHSGAVPP